MKKRPEEIFRKHGGQLRQKGRPFILFIFPVLKITHTFLRKIRDCRYLVMEKYLKMYYPHKVRAGFGFNAMAGLIDIDSTHCCS